ncbi:neutral zinc metallopeptidase, partial [Gandjariella thermophila]|uniref:neutral zinc metallopeptidase n=1 Tax=Gandjariella thermophila TaxID=1931992 RepID=UPI0010F9022C
MLAVVLCAVVLVGAMLAGVVGVATASHRTAEVGYTQPTAAPDTTEYVPDTGTATPTATTTTADTTTDAPTATGTAGPRRSAPATAAPPTATAPAGPRKVLATGDNPLFAGQLGLPAVTCDLPRWRSDPASAQAFFEAALTCLNQAWQPVLRAANLPFEQPALSFPAGRNWHSACGTTTSDQAAAFYCSADNTIYMPFDGLQTDQIGAHPGVYLAVFAHEYGHFIQGTSGVLDAAHEQMYDVDADSPAGLQISRRIELQADCFDGMFWAAATGRGAVNRTMYDEAIQDQRGRGDDNGVQTRRDHGNGAHVQGWTVQGAQYNRTAQCNTWTAAED